jgi:hypothetical protein
VNKKEAVSANFIADIFTEEVYDFSFWRKVCAISVSNVV